MKSATDELWIQRGNANHWIKVRLDGRRAPFNRAAIGAQVRALVGESVMTRQVEGGTGEGRHNDLTLHFGLGGYSGPVCLEITWPGGRRRNAVVAADRLTVLRFLRDGAG